MKKTLSILFCATFLFTGILQSRAAYIIPKTVAPIENPGSSGSNSVSSALSEFRHLSRKDRRMRIKSVKTEVKKFKAEKRAGSEPSTNTLLLVILAILLPPLAVYLYEGEINGKFWLDLLLTLLFFLPGVIYALIVVLQKD